MRTWLIILAALSDAKPFLTKKIWMSNDQLTRCLGTVVKNTPTTIMMTTFPWTTHRVHLRSQSMRRSTKRLTGEETDHTAEVGQGSYCVNEPCLPEAELITRVVCQRVTNHPRLGNPTVHHLITFLIEKAMESVKPTKKEKAKEMENRR